MHLENCFSDRYATYILSAVYMVKLHLLFICLDYRFRVPAGETSLATEPSN